MLSYLTLANVLITFDAASGVGQRDVFLAYSAVRCFRYISSLLAHDIQLTD